MHEDRPPPVLRTKGQPKRILERVRPALREHVRPHTKAGAGERLGWGTILAARWDHRLSRDVDAHVELDTTEDGRALLDRAAAACGGYRVEHPQFRRIEFERNRENHLDVSFGAARPAGGESTAIGRGRGESPGRRRRRRARLPSRASPAPRPTADRAQACRPGRPRALRATPLRDRFGLQQVVLVGDRGMLTAARIREDLADVEDLAKVERAFRCFKSVDLVADSEATFTLQTQPTLLQQRCFELLGVTPRM